MASHQIEEVVEVKCPSDFRLRDYVLGQDLFMLLGFDDYMLQGNWWGEINIIEDLMVEFKVKCEKGDTYNVTRANFLEDAFNEVKFRE